MKAVVMFPGGTSPQLIDRPSPEILQPEQLLLQVKAVAIKNLDISKATGKHYSSSHSPEGQIIGMDGVGLTPEGKRVYGISRDGILAELSLIDKRLIAAIPDGLDNATASAIPNAVMGSAMALLFRAKLKPGETVLINGATGVTGRVAIQVARYYGAGKIIVTGRNEESWPELKALGADQWITLVEDKHQFSEHVRAAHEVKPIDIVLDYLWGAPASAILEALKGKGDFTPPVRFVSIGGMAGDKIELSSSILRSTSLQLMGSGLGSWEKEEIGKLFAEIIPAFYQQAMEGKLVLRTKSFSLDQVAEMWNTNLPGGVRAVVEIS